MAFIFSCGPLETSMSQKFGKTKDVKQGKEHSISFCHYHPVPISHFHATSMGLFKRLFAIFRKKKVQILTCGLDGVGKTTIINFLKPKKAQVMDPPPTAGYAKEEFKKDNVHFTVVDMGGSGRYRALWEHYFEDCQGIVYVVDSSDKLRMCLSQDELQNILKHPQTSGKPLLVFANKMDVPAAMDAEEVAERLSLHEITDRPYTIVASDALHGTGIEEGISWLSAQLLKRMKK